MQEVILDTDILSDILRGLNPNVERHRDIYRLSFPQFVFTSASVFEILTGLRKRGAIVQRERAEALFDKNIEIVPEGPDYRLASDISGDLWAKGKPIGPIDPLIAACAIRRGYAVATGNTKHFEFIADVGYAIQLENWRVP